MTNFNTFSKFNNTLSVWRWVTNLNKTNIYIRVNRKVTLWVHII